MYDNRQYNNAFNRNPQQQYHNRRGGGYNNNQFQRNNNPQQQQQQRYNNNPNNSGGQRRGPPRYNSQGNRVAEDFDFETSNARFDKEKILEEVKVYI
jgi:hypothetical protein